MSAVEGVFIDKSTVLQMNNWRPEVTTRMLPTPPVWLLVGDGVRWRSSSILPMGLCAWQDPREQL